MSLPPVWKCFSTVQAEVGPRIEVSQLSESQSLYLSAAVCRAMNGGIMVHHRDSISSDAHIELHRVRSTGNGLRKRFDRVLGSVGAISPVTDNGASFRIEENVHRQKNNGAARVSAAPSYSRFARKTQNLILAEVKARANRLKGSQLCVHS